MPKHASRVPREVLLRDFAQRLSRLLIEKGWNQSEFARQAALHTKSKRFGRDRVSQYCRGVMLPTPLHLDAMARALGVKPGELLPSRGMPEIEEGLEPWDLRNLGDGHAWLKVNQRVPLPVALKILELLKET